MKPLLAHIYEPHRITFPCFVQPKLNGIRALYQNGHFQSRDELPFPNGLLSHLAEPLSKVFDPTIILDGELYVHGWPLGRINGAVTPIRQQPTEDTLKVEYHVFDQALYTHSFWQRFYNVKIKEVFLGNHPIHFIDTVQVNNQAEADIHYATWVQLGYEGMMYRLGDCPYTGPKQEWGNNTGWMTHSPTNRRARFLSDKDNRCWHLLKRKDWRDDEFEILSVVEGEGKLRGTLGALTCKTPSGQTFSVGSGLTDLERQHYWENPPIGRLVKVKYLVLSEDGIPLNPTILAIL